MFLSGTASTSGYMVISSHNKSSIALDCWTNACSAKLFYLKAYDCVKKTKKHVCGMDFCIPCQEKKNDHDFCYYNCPGITCWVCCNLNCCAFDCIVLLLKKCFY